MCAPSRKRLCVRTGEQSSLHGSGCKLREKLGPVVEIREAKGVKCMVYSTAKLLGVMRLWAPSPRRPFGFRCHCDGDK